MTRNVAFSVLLGLSTALAGGCVTSGKMTEALDAAKSEIRAENQAQIDAIRGELAAMKKTVADNIKEIGGQLAGQVADARKEAAANRDLIEKSRAERAKALQDLASHIDSVEANLKTNNEQTAQIAVQLGEVRTKYLSSLEWEATAMEQRLGNLKAMIAQLKGEAPQGEKAAAKKGEGK